VARISRIDLQLSTCLGGSNEQRRVDVPTMSSPVDTGGMALWAAEGVFTRRSGRQQAAASLSTPHFTRTCSAAARRRLTTPKKTWRAANRNGEKAGRFLVASMKQCLSRVVLDLH